jgi:DNA-binding transcriptional LysR family regulator
MTLQALQYFVAVARSRNYTRAAKECFVTQPALSRAIAGLEKELHCQLLERNTKGVALTAQGEVCLREAQEILEKCEQLRRDVRGEEATVYHACVGYAAASYLMSLHRRLEACGTVVEMDTEYGSVAQIKQKLLDGKLDVALLPKVNCEGCAELEYVCVERSRLCVLLHRDDPLALQTEVTVAQISGRPFVAWDEKEMPGINQAHFAACRQCGFEPIYVATGKKLGDIMLLLSRHKALALTSDNLAEALPREFKIVPIQNSGTHYGLACAWRAQNRSPAILAIRHALEVTAETADVEAGSLPESGEA